MSEREMRIQKGAPGAAAHETSTLRQCPQAVRFFRHDAG
jgi:hypothetical protein